MGEAGCDPNGTGAELSTAAAAAAAAEVASGRRAGDRMGEKRALAGWAVVVLVGELMLRPGLAGDGRPPAAASIIIIIAIIAAPASLDGRMGIAPAAAAGVIVERGGTFSLSSSLALAPSPSPPLGMAATTGDGMNESDGSTALITVITGALCSVSPTVM
jgi:hypothetical protein